jgi:hypothetical protein
MEEKDNNQWETSSELEFELGNIASEQHVMEDGTIIYRSPDGRRHREDGPAVIHPDGQMEWFINGLRENRNGPAFVSEDMIAYFQGGHLHNDDGPAVFYSNGVVEFWQHGVKYHTDQPSLIHTNGDQMWFDENQELHRDDGKPALIAHDGIRAWFIHGQYRLYPDVGIEYADGQRIFFLNEDNTYLKNVFSDGTIEYTLDGQRHRDDGPALITSTGEQQYWQHGVQLDGPPEDGDDGVFYFSDEEMDQFFDTI